MNVQFWSKQLNKYGESIFEYLQKFVPGDQIPSLLDIIKSKTHGEARQYVIDEHGHSNEAWYAMYALTRIESLIECLESPSDEPVQYEQALQAAVIALHAGIGAGAVVDGQAKEEIIHSLSTAAEHGKKFKQGRKEGDRSALTISLEEAFIELFDNGGKAKLPTRDEVIKHLGSSDRWKDTIHEVDFESEKVYWKGKSGVESSTSFGSIGNNMSSIRKKYK